MKPKISFITTTGVNIGDEFIREGISTFFDQIFKEWSPYYINKHDLTTLYRKIYDEEDYSQDKAFEADIIVQAGAPVYWKLGNATSYNVEWADELWFNRIFRLGPAKPILNIAAGACQPYPDFAKTFIDDPLCVDFAKKAAQACRWTSVRDHLASQILYCLDIPHEVLPCAAFHAARRHEDSLGPNSSVGINLMPLGGHFVLRDDVNPEAWEIVIREFLAQIRRRHRITFIAHDETERNFMARFKCADENIFFSSDYRDYFKVYGTCSVILANRVHGAICAAGFGRPAIIIGNDSRLMIGDFIGLTSKYVGNISSEEVVELIESAYDSQWQERDRLLSLREESAKRYCEAILANVPDVIERGVVFVRSDSIKRSPSECFAIVSANNYLSKSNVDFITMLNSFAARYGLTQYKLTAEYWYYPWLWFNVLAGGKHWAQLNILCLNSELSPIPWLLASFGANVILIDRDAQCAPFWARLNAETGLRVSWKDGSGESLPFSVSSFSHVLSLSAIENLRSSHLSLDEIARVLIPGGIFASYYYINATKTIMTDFDRNDNSFIKNDIREIFWSRPDFFKFGMSQWDKDDLEGCIDWQDQRMENHKTVVGASVLRKKLFDESLIKKILLPRFDTHGDIVLLQGVVQVLLDRFPHADITIFVRDGYDQLAPLFPSRLQWKTQPYNPWARYSHDDIPGISRMLDEIESETWDLVLFTTYNRTFLEDLVGAKLNRSMKIGIGRPTTHVKWQEHVLGCLSLQAVIDDVLIQVDEFSHETEKYDRFLKELFGADVTIPPPRLTVPEILLQDIKLLLSGMGLQPGGYVLCVPAGVQNVPIKKWSEEKFAEILVWLSDSYGLRPLVVGHESERMIVEKVVTLVKNKAVACGSWLGTTGELSVLAGLLNYARFFVGNDTGPMHMAAALEVPLVGIFGGGTWPRFLPMGRKSLAVSCQLTCYYCMWDCIFENAPCLSSVGVEDVKEAIAKVIAETVHGEKCVHSVDTGGKIGGEHIQRAKRIHSFLKSELHKCQLTVEEYSAAQEQMNILLSKSKEEIDNLKGIINTFNKSISWRVTAPIRKLLDIIRK